MPRLEERLGRYELAAGIAECVERLRAEPDLVLDRLAGKRSVWSGADNKRERRLALVVRSGHDVQIEAAAQAVIRASVAIDTDAYTIQRVVSEEQAGFWSGGDAGRLRADREAKGCDHTFVALAKSSAKSAALSVIRRK